MVKFSRATFPSLGEPTHLRLVKRPPVPCLEIRLALAEGLLRGTARIPDS